MLFDLRPKESPRDLFDREKELQELGKLIESEWVAVVGARMTGKTSLVKTFLNSRKAGVVTLYTNLLGAKGIRDFVTKLSESLASSEIIAREVSLKLPFVEVTRSSRAVEGIFAQLKNVKKDVIIVLDEVQELYRVSGQFLKMLKMIHDTYPRVRFIFTGSMFGLMRTLLQPKVSSAMHGRKPAKIELKPFTEELSINFLASGFEELRTPTDEEELKEIVGALDGYVGWLTYYGNFRCVRKVGRKDALGEVIDEGGKVVKGELRNFLKSRNKGAYMTVLRAASLGARWSDIKKALERKFGEFNNKRISDVLDVLRMSMLIEKRGRTYVVPDPVVKRAIMG